MRLFFVLLPGLLLAQADVILTGGTVVDGTGAPARRADIAIKGDRIVRIGDLSREKAGRVLDAKGLVIAPGFIDPHTHALEDLLDDARKANLNFLMQGVTTVITGNDGGGPVNTGEILSKWEQGIGTNAALLAGHASIRREVLAMSDAVPTAEQLDRMKGLLGRSLEAGAIGFSTGLFYAPGSFATTEEVIELAKVAAAAGRYYDSHVRDESSYTIGFLGSVKETLRIAREAKIPVHFAHIKCLGTDVWGQSKEAIALIREARAQGMKITADQYPYTASGTGLSSALVPRWVMAGGKMRERLSDPSLRGKIVAEMTENMRRRGGAASLLITGLRGSGPKDRALIGKNLEEIAKMKGKPPVEAAIEIMLAAGDAGVASFNMNEDDIAAFMKEDWVMTGSDGSDGHPRKYGTYPRKLRVYVYEKKRIPLEFAIRSMTSLPAQTFGIRDRGVLKEGALADVVAFDPATIRDEASYTEPQKLASGMRYVLVNGKIAVEGGKPAPVLAGRPVRPGR
ncbi:MAG: D-aminoacylase [Bryobacteraceae bacterium]|nr:D-aminoacylase [Bryobacteraceae bacterium]